MLARFSEMFVSSMLDACFNFVNAPLPLGSPTMSFIILVRQEQSLILINTHISDSKLGEGYAYIYYSLKGRILKTGTSDAAFLSEHSIFNNLNSLMLAIILAHKSQCHKCSVYLLLCIPATTRDVEEMLECPCSWEVPSIYCHTIHFHLSL